MRVASEKFIICLAKGGFKKRRKEKKKGKKKKEKKKVPLSVEDS